MLFGYLLVARQVAETKLSLPNFLTNFKINQNVIMQINYYAIMEAEYLLL